MKADIRPPDPIDQALRSRLRDSEAGQAPSWDSFLAHESVKRTTHISMRRRIYRMGSVAAVVLVLLTIGSTYMFRDDQRRLPEPSSPEIRLTTKQTLQNTRNIIAQRKETRTVENPGKRLSGRGTSTTSFSTDTTVVKVEIIEVVTQKIEQQIEQSSTSTHKSKSTDERRNKTKGSRSNLGSYYNDEASPAARRKSSPFALGAYSLLGYGSKEITSTATPSMVMYTVGKYSGNMEVAEDQFEHKFPVTVGLALQYDLGKRFSIHSGMTYSYLESTASREMNFQYHYTRKNHYLGIPLGISYSMLDSRRIELYVSVGAMAEWAISSKLTSTLYSGREQISTTTTSNKTRGAIFSANAALGVNVKITQDLGIYVEPGVSHYFDNTNHPVNFRTQWPVQFSLRAGVRVRL